MSTLADTFETISSERLAGVSGGFGAQLTSAMHRAKQLGLRVTSTTGGKHAKHSYHYAGRAIDFAGSASSMRKFFTEMSHTHPTELFYDPMGAMKHGHFLNHSIGGHHNHVHVAY